MKKIIILYILLLDGYIDVLLTQKEDITDLFVINIYICIYK